jgi:6-phosphogluconolactonase
MVASGIALLAIPSIARSARTMSLVAGTYAAEGGGGLYPLTQAEAGWMAGSPIAPIRNASFGVQSSRTGLRYLLNETKQGSLGIYDGRYRVAAAASTHGADPCHAALSPDQSAIAVANYSSGNVTLWRLNKVTGLPEGEPQISQHEGTGPNVGRQAGPHAHWFGFSNDARWLHSVDLGADAIFAHHFSPDTGSLGEMRVAYHADPGTGPRHLARHPRLPICYLVAELANTVTVLHAQDDGSFRANSVISTLPAGVRDASYAAHIALNAAGSRLYVSNRGHDSIAVFAIEADGAPHLMQHIDCGGHWPRFFLLLEDQGEMLVANERSGTVAQFSLDRDGRLRLAPRSFPVPGVAFLGR